jgi:hypothetical protein
MLLGMLGFALLWCIHLLNKTHNKIRHRTLRVRCAEALAPRWMN